MINKKFLLFICSCLLAMDLQAQTIRYVKQDGTGDGSSWTNASGDLQEIINASAANDEIWVAAGTYKPNRRADALTIITLNNRHNAFVLKKDVKIYGNFAGNETSLEQRNLPDLQNLTSILSGDFKGDDERLGAEAFGMIINISENAYHVVISAGEVDNACLDGFTITGGAADGLSSTATINAQVVSARYGGGITCYSSSPILANLNIDKNSASFGGGISNTNSSPTLDNVLISQNYTWNAGGMYNTASSPILNNVIFTENRASTNGGGMQNVATSSPVLTNVTISNNSADSYGAGISNWENSSPILTNVKIIGNTGGTEGFGSNGGGIYNNVSSPVLTNVTISDNSASEGGGIDNYSSSPILTNVVINNNKATSGYGGGISVRSFSSPIITNVSISNNTSVGGGGIYIEESSPVLTNVSISGNLATGWNGGNGMYYWQSSTPVIRNTIIWGNGSVSRNVFTSDSTPVYSHCLVEGVTADGIILAGVNPLFVNAAVGDLRLLSESPCINAGNNVFFDAGQIPDLSAITSDLAENARILGSAIDLGAYEYDADGGTRYISGQITENGSPLVGVTVSYGDGVTVITDNVGKYNIAVDINSTVTLTPNMIGYVFTPENILCENVTDHLTSKNFAATKPVIKPNQNGILYVTLTGAGTKDGSSWKNAADDLQAAINASVANNQIWVAAGTYKPRRKANALTVVTPNHRDNAFVLKKDVKIYGSFAGTETSLDERQLPENYNYTSILSGDFLDNDGENFSKMEENAYHVVLGVYDVGTACLDGFTITGGNANDISSHYIVVNSQNIFPNSGGGLYLSDASPMLTNLNVRNNYASTSGGGLDNRRSSPCISNVMISGNKAQSGGGVSNGSSNPVFTNVIIKENIANGGGGGVRNSNQSPIFINVVITGNTANTGAGIYNNYSSPIFTNVSVSGNNAQTEAGGMYNWYSTDIQVRNSIIWGNGSSNTGNRESDVPVYSNSLVQGVTAEGIILNGIDPLFVNAANGNLRLQADSPCINVGNNSLFDLSVTTVDLAGNPRIVANAIDLGAYEYQDGTSNISETEITATKTPIAFYNIMGIKLNKAPESGIYIILYDNGTAEKVLK